jgi:hypothetical protein
LPDGFFTLFPSGFFAPPFIGGAFFSAAITSMVQVNIADNLRLQDVLIIMDMYQVSSPMARHTFLEEIVVKH